MHWSLNCFQDFIEFLSIIRGHDHLDAMQEQNGDGNKRRTLPDKVHGGAGSIYRLPIYK